ncbi:hypothetical protein CK203_004967 [Vitis vinifera]|uniref:Retrotransposon Copia-like N-terminal domain-containing protein n=1 Tax=Vitis vinifera TaxID=29760 RepID=A0A438KF84_VITVI|nr:hypothetical protein CK203_004967 [Vitis vinifera]
MSEVAETTTTTQSEGLFDLNNLGIAKHLGPKLGDPCFEAWDEEDSMVMAWLWNSITPKISDTCEESRRSVMLEPQTLDGSTLVAKTEYSEQGKNDLPKHLGRDNQWKENKDNLWCTFCKKPRHTKEKCWKLNGKPPSREWGNRGGQQRPQAHMAEQPKTEENSATAGTPSLSFCINASHREQGSGGGLDLLRKERSSPP